MVCENARGTFGSGFFFIIDATKTGAAVDKPVFRRQFNAPGCADLRGYSRPLSASRTPLRYLYAFRFFSYHTLTAFGISPTHVYIDCFFVCAAARTETDRLLRRRLYPGGRQMWVINHGVLINFNYAASNFFFFTFKAACNRTIIKCVYIYIYIIIIIRWCSSSSSSTTNADGKSCEAAVAAASLSPRSRYDADAAAAAATAATVCLS